MESLEKMRKAMDYLAYYYQEDNYHNSTTKSDDLELIDTFIKGCSRAAEYFDKTLWNITPTPIGDAKPYSCKDLEDVTCSFHPSSVLKVTRHGRLFNYRGHEALTIKTWDFFWPTKRSHVDHPTRFCNELEILTDENRHPCLMKLNGFCFQYKLAVVYDEKPTTYLSDVLHSGKNFEWNDRMKVATQLASLFTWLHERRFAFGGMEPSSIMIDKDFNIKVFDFGFLVRVREEDEGVLSIPYLNLPDAPEAYEGTRTLKSDVYVFGVLLVGLIANKEKVYAQYYNWIVDVLQGGKRSIVDRSLLRRDYDGELACRITKLAADCLAVDPNARPDMKDVSVNLSNLISNIAVGQRQVMHQSDNIRNVVGVPLILTLAVGGLGVLLFKSLLHWN